MDEQNNNIIVYCSVLWSYVSEKDSLGMFTDEMKQEINKTETKLQEGTSKSAIQVPVIPVWVPYKTLNNLTELPIGSIQKVTAIGYAKHYGTDKLVVQQVNCTLYQAGEFLEGCKDSLLNGCKNIDRKTYLYDQAETKRAQSGQYLCCSHTMTSFLLMTRILCVVGRKVPLED